jgi:hypothetical protein
LQQHEQRVQAQCAQQQRQIAALSADVRTMHAAGFVVLFDFYFNSNYSHDGIDSSPVGGMSALLLALAMPFVSPERIVAMLGAVAGGIKSSNNTRIVLCGWQSLFNTIVVVSAGKQLRRLWAIALALDVSARYAAARGVRVQLVTNNIFVRRETCAPKIIDIKK